MARILICTFVAATLLLNTRTFARDRRCGCGTSRPTVCCDTIVSDGCDGCVNCGANFPTVGCGTVVSSGCASCSGGAYQIEGANAGSGVDTRIGINTGSGVDTGGGANAGSGDIKNGGGSVTGGGRLDPDVLTGQTGGPLGQQNVNTERIWTDSSGQHKRLARFIRIEGTQVILQNAQGRTTRVDIQSLSTADQLFVDQLRQTSMKAAFPSNQQPRVATRS
jgi:hypothetical protein